MHRWRPLVALAVIVVGLHSGPASAGAAVSGMEAQAMAVSSGSSHRGVAHLLPRPPIAEPARRTAAEGRLASSVKAARRSRSVRPIPVGPAVAAGSRPCTPGPACDPGPSTTIFSDYGGAGPDGIADCTFAAAANWEQIVLGLMPDPATVETEFAAAGGTAEGLAQDTLWAYWQQAGIDGVRLLANTAVPTDPADVEPAVRANGALIAQLQVSPAGIGNFTATPGLHDLVVDGFTPIGPLVVSWGQTIQMTWQQWTVEVVAVWMVAAEPAAPDTSA